MPLRHGHLLGPYEIVAPLGAGGMGEVHRARDTRLGREVAVKVLPEQLTKDAVEVAESFLRKIGSPVQAARFLAATGEHICCKSTEGALLGAAGEHCEQIEAHYLIGLTNHQDRELCTKRCGR
ncbi:MAG TPA: hypothetical protein VMV94_17915 [Phycisphaerae bacterium]|nr:hypothetical protein [Phycisphaerae bacterium]